MRTTIELNDELRARLLDLAARRGEKGFSRFIGEAVEQYLDRLDQREPARERALAMQGSLDEEEAAALEAAARRVREHWR